MSRARIFKHLRSSRIDSKESILPAYVAWRARARICKRLRSSGINSKESTLPADVAWRASTSNRVVVPARQAGNRFLGSLKGLQIRAQYDNPIPTRFLSPIDGLKIPALSSGAPFVHRKWHLTQRVWVPVQTDVVLKMPLINRKEKPPLVPI